MAKEKIIKNLRFELSLKEYSDFWFIASLLKLTKKKDVLVEMMNIVKKNKQ